MKFPGELFTYDEEDRLTAFECGSIDRDKVVVFIGGLGDGYNAVPFLEPLFETVLDKKGWSLIQVQLSSSYQGYGINNLQTDVEELDKLVYHLKTYRGKKTIVLLGHSTGSQDCYWHNKYGKTNQDIASYILQAPVSDREYFQANLENFQFYVDMAINYRREGKGEELLPRDSLFGTPITANRFYSLTVKGGDDDVFSTDLSDEEIKKLYENVNRPICWIYSENDEFYVNKVEKQSDVMQRFQNICSAIKETHIIPNGDHSITRKDSQIAFCKVIDDFLNKY
ncbi:uncharacterized protein BX663DRAFT_511384 [Cokeromyces recurvatus]|uniref:uncharacterized protein n=1 Tax=Cokeromyces recurvatus TaxID=90255 RepID=UPI00221F64D8|nr:uncharacterized protein BX663DRAFT_511384 [Cokeromyces recurvatus]KAI7902533.1 hypothetical protein BX663DRAFT_511384 [Cokeromyces recurvatus]